MSKQAEEFYREYLKSNHDPKGKAYRFLDKVNLKSEGKAMQAYADKCLENYKENFYKNIDLDFIFVFIFVKAVAEKLRE